MNLVIGLWKHAFYADSDDLPQGVESLSQVCIRARKAWAHVMGIEARTVVVITHDEFGNYLINEMLRKEYLNVLYSLTRLI